MDYMTSLQIAEITGKQHKDVLKAIRTMEDAWVKVCGRKFALTSQSVEMPNGGYREEPCYALNKTECLYIATKFNDEARAKLVLRWEELETEKANGGFKVPQSYSEALMLAANQARHIEEQQRQIEQKDKAITKLQPKADFADAAFATDDKVDIGMSAKILKLGFGRNTLFKKLKEKGILFGNRNEPKQKYVDAGHFELTEKFIERNDHPGFVVTKVLVTQKGLAYINHLFNGKPSDGKMLVMK